MINFKPPKALIFDQQIHKTYEKFLTNFDIFMEAAGLADKADERKIAIFLNVAGEGATDLFQPFDLEEAEKKNYEVVINK